MTARRFLAVPLLAALALAACQPPAAEAEAGSVRLADFSAKAAPLAAPSAPIASPDAADAVWTGLAEPDAPPTRLVYGVPGKPALLALDCLAPATPQARVRITRHAAADAGAGAMLAVIGNGTIGRFEVDATETGGRRMWQGEAPAAAQGWNALDGLREATVTVPGAGLVRLNPSPLPGALIKACRAASV